jgi:hypothetical protein
VTLTVAATTARSPITKLLAVGVCTALLAAGCGADAGQPSASGPSLNRGTGGLSLAAVCPATVVVQAAWTPEAEHGALYHLVGQGYAIDAGHKRVSGPLVAGGRDTGVKIEIRAGGPAIGVQNAGVQMYTDPDVMLAQVATDDAVSISQKQPVLAVMAPFDRAPYMIMWDPRAYPQFHSVVDIGKTNTKVLYYGGATYMEYLVGSGILRREQVDGSYQGAPDRWVSAGGRIAQQGFATSEPYLYENVLPQWKKPVAFQLVHDTGYPIYPEAIVIRADRKAQYSACLKRLVPIIQRSQVEYAKDPAAAAATNDLVVKANEAYKGFPYSREQAEFSRQQQVKLGIVGNGGNETLGDFDSARVGRVLDIVVPIYDGQRKPVKAGLEPPDLFTNEFIDSSIGL